MTDNNQLLPCPFCNSSVMPGQKYCQCSNSACPAFHIKTTPDQWSMRGCQHAGLTVPEGHVLVPAEPTPEMLRAGVDQAVGALPIYRAMLAAAPHPVSGEQKAHSVQITGHLDEVDAPVWEFINAEARKLGPVTGSIDTYNFARPNGAQPNGVLAVLWNGASIHAMAVTVRDSMNRTQCVRLLADAEPAAQDVSDIEAMVTSLENREWADHIGVSPLGQRLEMAITDLFNRQQGVIGLVAALTDARQTLATALKSSAPDWFKTEADIASHHTIKKIDAALASLHGEQKR